MRPLLAGAALLLLFLGAVAAMEPVDIELSAKPAPKQACKCPIRIPKLTSLQTPSASPPSERTKPLR